MQGLVVDLKSYAAERATQEGASIPHLVPNARRLTPAPPPIADGKRVTDTAIAPVQASPELDTLEGERTRREVTTTARRKVSAAVATIRAQRAQPQAGSDDKSSEAGPSRDDDDMSLEELAHERQLLLRLGFSEEARELGKKATALRGARVGERQAREETMLKQRLWSLELGQKRRRDELARHLDEGAASAASARKAEMEDLTVEQAKDYQRLVEMVTKAAAQEVVELPPNLTKHRYKPSQKLYTMRRNVERFEESGWLQQAAEWRSKAEALEEEELTLWQQRFLATCLGDDASSELSKLLKQQKVVHDRLADRQKKQAFREEKLRTQRRESLEGTFRVERWKAIDGCKKAAQEREAAAAKEEMLQRQQNRDVVWYANGHAGEVGGAAASVRDGGSFVPQRSDGSVWIAPKATGLAAVEVENGLVRRADDDMAAWQHALSCCMWASTPGRVLNSLLVHPGADVLRPLQQYLKRSERSADLELLKLLREVALMHQLEPSAAADRAMELYELMLGERISGDALFPPSEAPRMVEQVDARAAVIRDAFLDDAFPSFLGTSECSTLIEQLAHADRWCGIPHALHHQPIGLVEHFQRVAAGLPVAIVLVNTQVAGLPIAFVNPAFVELTGYQVDELVGKNCRMLQGECTEAAVVAEMVHHIREGLPCRVLVTNYRKDRTRFRNGLMLHPVHDSEGRSRYFIGLACDADRAAKAELARLTVLHRLLPASFQLRLQELDVTCCVKSPGERPRPIDTTASEFEGEFTPLLAGFFRMICQEEPLRTFRHALRCGPLFARLASIAPSSEALRLLVDAQALPAAGPAREDAVVSLYSKHLEKSQGSLGTRNAEPLVMDAIEVATRSVGSKEWAQFVRRPEAGQKPAELEEVVRGMDPGILPCTAAAIGERLWSRYEAPRDAEAFISAMIIWADWSQIGITLADATISGLPLIYVNEAFCRITEYSRQAVLGRSCRILQGPDTEPDAVAAVLASIRSGTDAVVKITNYRASGERFTNLLALRAVRDGQQQRFFIGLQCELPPQGGDAPGAVATAQLLFDHLPQALRPAAKPGGARPTARRASAQPKQPRPPVSTSPIDAAPANPANPRFEAALHGKPQVAAAGPCGVCFIASRRLAPPCQSLVSSSGLRKCILRLSCLSWMHAPNAVKALRALRRIDGAWSELHKFVNETTPEAADEIAAIASSQRPRDIPSRPLFAWHRFMASADGQSALLECLDELPTLCDLHSCRLSFIELLEQAVGSLPIAIAGADLLVPGLPLSYVNAAWSALTGYSRRDAVGRSARLLQGPDTEAATVAELSARIREGRSCDSVVLINYTQDGRRFQHQLALHMVLGEPSDHPVRSGTFSRYAISVSIDADKASSEDRDRLSLVRQLLPSQVDASLFESPASSLPADKVAQVRQYSLSALPLEEQLVLESGKLGVRRLLELEGVCESVMTRVASDDQRAQVKLVRAVRGLGDLSPGERTPKARGIARQLLPHEAPSLMALSETSLMSHLSNAAAKAVDEISQLGLVQSLPPQDLDDAVLSLLESGGMPDPYKHLWEQYSLPSEVAGWLAAFVQVAEACAASIVLSDMSLAGAPMVYVNDAFCEFTGYTKREVLGSNCRFLQGPHTEASKVAQLSESLRQGEACAACLTNYRKDGETFQNLLLCLPVHDSTGVYRFCIGIQAAADDCDRSAIARLATRLPASIRAVYTRPAAAMYAAGALLAGSPVMHNGGGQTAETAAFLRETLASHFQFQHLDSACQAALATAMRREVYTPNHRLFREGDPPEFMCIVEEGEVVSITAAGQLHERLQSGTLVGETAVVYDCPSPTASLIGAAGAVLWVIDAYIVHAIVQAHGCALLGGEAAGCSRPAPPLLHCDKEIHPITAEAVERCLEQALVDSLDGGGDPAVAQNHSGMLDKLMQIDATCELSRLMWCRSLVEAATCLLQLEKGRAALEATFEEPPVPTLHWMSRALASGGDARGLLEEVDGSLDTDALDESEIGRRLQSATTIHVRRFAEHVLPLFVASPHSMALLRDLPRTSETQGLLLTPRPSWRESFEAVAEMLPVAISLADYRVPGLPLVFVNRAWQSLTGYTREEVTGASCRLLQGEQTEAASTSLIVESLRNACSCEVVITNYQKNGSAFRNELSLHMVFDQNDACRYVVGLAGASSDLRLLIARLLPTQIPSSLEPMHALWESSSSMPDLTQGQRAFGQASGEFGRALCFRNAPEAIWSILQDEEAAALFEDLVQGNTDAQLRIQLCMQAFTLDVMFGEDQEEEALKIYYEYLALPGARSPEAAEALERIEVETARARDHLATTVLPAVLADPRSSPLVQVAAEVTPGDPGAIWPNHEPSQALRGWLSAVVGVSDQLEVGITVSDFASPGNPLVFVNTRFCELTGYDSAECLGRNCRFLQGPESEQRAVAKMICAMRAGEECVVRLSNYRKDGTKFELLLALCPIRCGGKLVYYVGLHVVLSESIGLARALADMELLLEHMPAAVATKATGLKPRTRDYHGDLIQCLGRDGDEGDGEESTPSEEDLFSRAMWARSDPEPLLRRLLALPIATVALRAHMEDFFEGNLCTFCSCAIGMHAGDAATLMDRFLPELRDSSSSAQDLVQSQLEECIQKLAVRWQSFLNSPSCARLVRRLRSTLDAESARRLFLLAPEPPASDAKGLATQLFSSRHWLRALAAAWDEDPTAVAIADAQLPGVPLVYVNPAFEQLTGYTSDEVVGRNCRFLQGPETSRAAVSELTAAIQRHTSCTVSLANYHKAGSGFTNSVTVLPILDVVTGEPRIHFSLSQRYSVAPLAAASQRLAAEKIQATIPRVVRFLTPTPSVSDGVVAVGAPLLVPGEARHPWSGAPIRRHRSALLGVLQLRGEVVFDGLALFSDFVTAHWRRCGRIKARDGSKASVEDSIMSVQLALYSSSIATDPLAYLSQILVYIREVAGLAALSGEDKTEKMTELYASHVKAERGVIRRRKKSREAWRKVEEKKPDLSELAPPEMTREAGDAASQGATRPVSPAGSVATSFSSALQEDVERSLELHRDTLANLLVFDAWHAMISSPVGANLEANLAASDDAGEVRMSELISSCRASLPVDTDGWLRLLISAVHGQFVGVLACDMTLPGAPIIFVNSGFERISGYTNMELHGGSCRRLSSPESNEETIEQMRQAMRTATEVKVQLLNRKKDGTDFLHLIALRPIFDSSGLYRFMLGVTVEVTQSLDRMKHRLAQMERLLQLVPSRLSLPSPSAARERAQLTRSMVQVRPPQNDWDDSKSARGARARSFSGSASSKQRLHNASAGPGKEVKVFGALPVDASPRRLPHLRSAEPPSIKAEPPSEEAAAARAARAAEAAAAAQRAAAEAEEKESAAQQAAAAAAARVQARREQLEIKGGGSTSSRSSGDRRRGNQAPVSPNATPPSGRRDISSAASSTTSTSRPAKHGSPVANDQVAQASLPSVSTLTSENLMLLQGDLAAAHESPQHVGSSMPAKSAIAGSWPGKEHNLPAMCSQGSPSVRSEECASPDLFGARAALPTAASCPSSPSVLSPTVPTRPPPLTSVPSPLLRRLAVGPASSNGSSSSLASMDSLPSNSGPASPSLSTFTVLPRSGGSAYAGALPRFECHTNSLSTAKAAPSLASPHLSDSFNHSVMLASPSAEASPPQPQSQCSSGFPSPLLSAFPPTFIGPPQMSPFSQLSSCSSSCQSSAVESPDDVFGAGLSASEAPPANTQSYDQPPEAHMLFPHFGSTQFNRN